MSTLVLEASQRIRAQGMRMTAQRRLILSTLSGLDTHPTAEELFRITHQQDPSLNLSTVYRALALARDRRSGAVTPLPGRPPPGTI